MMLRPYRRADAPHLVAILHDSVHAIDVRDYTKARRDAWSPAPMPPEQYHARVSDGRTVTVAVSNHDQPIAFIELEADGHIDCFYCHPEVAGSGVGRALFRQTRSNAIAAGVTRLYVEASEAARRFFRRKGFQVIARREFQLSGVSIHNYAMEKRLDLIHA